VGDIRVILNTIQSEINKMINTLNETVELSERQAAATEEVATSMQQLTASSRSIEKIASSL
jgi:methyl-accepting chemotaxis protein